MKFEALCIGLLSCLFLLSGCSEKNWTPGNSTIEDLNSSTGPLHNRAKIIGGEEVAPSDPIAPSTVALYMPQDDSENISNFCTGTLIAKNVVLTAGHCFLDVAQIYLHIPLNDFVAKVRVGFGLDVVTSEQNQKVTMMKIRSVTLHPEYRAGMVNRAMQVPMPDLAIIQLDGDAPETAIPATIGTDPELIKDGREILIAGFGVTAATNRTMPKQLMKANVTINNAHLTTAQFSYKVVNGKSACFADSGGPAYFETEKGKYVLGGVTSWGDGYCARMGAYTSVPAFADFISATVASFQ